MPDPKLVYGAAAGVVWQLLAIVMDLRRTRKDSRQILLLPLDVAYGVLRRPDYMVDQAFLGVVF